MLTNIFGQACAAGARLLWRAYVYGCNIVLLGWDVQGRRGYFYFLKLREFRGEKAFNCNVCTPLQRVATSFCRPNPNNYAGKQYLQVSRVFQEKALSSGILRFKSNA